MNAKKIKRIFIILIAIFAVIYILCFIYQLCGAYSNSYYSEPARYLSASMYSSYDGNFYEFSGSKPVLSNVATERQMISGDKGIEVSYDQKYEMISKITSTSESDKFEDDVGTLRKTIEDLNGVIQMEYTYGLEEHNDRSLWVQVGIPPSKFDLLVEQVKQIGSLTSFSVNKIDKTAEFQSYLAQREALEKALDSYISIKSQGGAIAELLILEEKIIQTEKEILQMGVTLGVYEESQSMCTVDFTLYEGRAAVQTRSIDFYTVMNCAIFALGWSLLIYFGGIMFVLVSGFSAMGIAFLLSRITKQTAKKAETPKTDNNNNINGDGGIYK